MNTGRSSDTADRVGTEGSSGTAGSSGTVEFTASGQLEAAITEVASAQQILVALDFDGVLAPLVPDPNDSRPIPEAARALDRLARADGVQLALVSGRPVADLGALASPPPGTWLVGSHGAQRADIDADGALVAVPFALEPDQQELLDRVTAALEKIAAEPEFDGAWVEHKPAAAALHTRPLAQRDAGAAERARAFALAGPASWPGTHASPGSQVVEIPVVKASKGEAVAELRHRLRTDSGSEVAVLFAGDDVTDETALATLGPGDLGVKVGTKDSVARARVPDESAMAALLHRLADLRA